MLTEHLFAHDNPAFCETLLRREGPVGGDPFVVFIDANVAASVSSLEHDIAGYAGVLGPMRWNPAFHPVRLPAASRWRHDLALLTRLQHRLVELVIPPTTAPS